MKISYKQLYDWLDNPAPNGIDDLLGRIGMQLGGIEETEKIGPKYDGAVIVRVISCEDHPNADRLHVCMVDDGGKTADVPRNEQGLVQVVCGAPNVTAGVTVVWLPPGATVPSSYDTDPFVLEARELRGVVSNGMLASPKELAIGDSHEGLLLIDEDVQPGTPFAEQYNLNDDVIIDIENKMFTHRPDLFGWLGIAREIAGIYDRQFVNPDWYAPDAAVPAGDRGLRVEVRNEIPELVPRFTVVPVAGIAVGPSPVWLQVQLARVGIRPINNIVDLTNYYMLLTGQPLHAYDYDKVVAQDSQHSQTADHATLVVRKPHEDEKLLLLNGKEVQPRAEAILIATNNVAIGLGGIMGGGDTEVDDDTTNIILECANFDMYSIRRTSMAAGIFSDATTRFTKGQSPLQNIAVLAKVVDDVLRICGGEVAGDLVDDNHLPSDVRDRGALYPPVTVSEDFINARLGLTLQADDMARLLRNVNFDVAVDSGSLTIKAPFWRTDIEISEDIVEEIGRLYGFDKLPAMLPHRTIKPAAKDQLLETKSVVRDTLSRAGANEVLTYSFVHGALLDKVGQNKDQAFKLGNALSPDLQYYRLSLTPSLLDKLHANIKAGYDEFTLFEIGKAHNKTENDYQGLPREVNAMSLVVAADKRAAARYDGAPYYEARKFLDYLLDYTNAKQLVHLEPLEGADLYHNPWIQQMVMPYEPKRSAVLRAADGVIWGVVGEFKAGVRKALKLPDFTAGFEIDPLLLLQTGGVTSYTPLPRFPKVEQDMTLKVAASLPYRELSDYLQDRLRESAQEETLSSLTLLDIYQREDDAEHKQITFRLSIASYAKTMTDTEVAALLDSIAATASEKFGAARV